MDVDFEAEAHPLTSLFARVGAVFGKEDAFGVTVLAFFAAVSPSGTTVRPTRRFVPLELSELAENEKKRC